MTNFSGKCVKGSLRWQGAKTRRDTLLVQSVSNWFNILVVTTQKLIASVSVELVSAYLI